ncbi:holin family protein [Phaeobacter inhibens]|uniref:holin family protein n=1 Tax=Phaeobacter inhibens TaxID=221822 RepID=UPI0021A84C9E|nr:holin family protein [Phaeobacter inhibens]UWR74843.1 holin family protein [Phaeobacter inhibens]
MQLLKWLFGGGRNVIAETAGVFRPHAEASAQREAAYVQSALAQHGAEFSRPAIGRFDRFMDGMNRLPRPLMVIATFALFASAMFDPLWFAARMQGLALVPDPLWWLAGTIVAFYFGGRFQVKSQQFRQSLNQGTALLPQVLENISAIDALRHDTPGAAEGGVAGDDIAKAQPKGENQAVTDWWEAGQKR